METKKQIRPVLRDLKLYESETYPIEDVASVRATIQLLQVQRPIRFTTKMDNGVVKVTRTK